jgi:hypothetical protein
LVKLCPHVDGVGLGVSQYLNDRGGVNAGCCPKRDLRQHRIRKINCAFAIGIRRCVPVAAGKVLHQRPLIGDRRARCGG